MTERTNGSAASADGAPLARYTLRSTLDALNRFVSGRRRALGRMAVVALVGGVLEAIFLLLVTRTAFAITDKRHRFGAIAGHSLTVHAALVISVVIVLIRIALAILNSAQAATLTTVLVARTRQQLSSAYLQASWRLQQDDRTGRLQELLTRFAQRGTDLVTNVSGLVTAGCSLIALLAMAIGIDPVGAVIVIVLVALLSSVLRPIRVRVRHTAVSTATTGMEFATGVGEVSQLGMDMHVFDVQDALLGEIDRLIDVSAASERQLSFIRAVLPQVYTGLAYLAVTAALALAAFSSSTKLESLGAVMLVMLRSLSYGQAIQSSSTAVLASMPFLELLDQNLDRYRSDPAPRGTLPAASVGRLELRDVTFGYDPERPVLHDLSFTIEPRSVVGIIGPSGSGKSTLVQLLLGLREPLRGEVLADDRPVSRLLREEWARRVTFVPQSPHLFTGTILDNIRFYRDSVTADDVERATRQAHLYDEVMALPGGFDHHIGERGEHLSGGQRQRVCIARALAERPDVLILDEPTSALDVRSEHHIREALEELRREMTIVIIAHRLSTLDICDRLMVIQDGRLMGYDSPAGLATSSKFYTEILRLSGLTH